jgi:predicted dinucleotide-utilizing enzyme
MRQSWYLPMTSKASSSQATSGGLAVIACGALAKEILELQRLNHLSFELTCIPAAIHNRPQEIPQAVEKKILEAKSKNQEIFVRCGIK